MQDPETLRALLREEGYQWLLHQNTWFECLLWHDRERWLGRGATADEALDDALHQCLPSSLGWRLLQRFLTAPVEVVDVAPTPADDAPVEPPADPTPVGVEPAIAAESPAPAAVVDDAPRPTSGASRPSSVGGTPAPSPTPAPAAIREVQAEPTRPELPREYIDRALAEVQHLRRQIDADSEELALSAPARQRLVMLGWIAAARAVEEEIPDDERVTRAVQGVAKQLTTFCKRWWPGSVKALQLDCRPEQVVNEIPGEVLAPPRTWYEAREVIESALERAEQRDLDAGRDAQGWSDGARLTPYPRDPVSLLGELTAAIEAQSGPLEQLPDAHTTWPDPARAAEWARKLRWLRGCTDDGLRWGLLAGRIRWWIEKGARDRYAEAARVMDPTYAPDAPWASLLGTKGKNRERSKLIREVFAQAPAVKSAPGEATIIGWLQRALPLADTHHANIVSAMEPFRPAVLALRAEQFPEHDRRMRRRLALLQRDLGAAATVVPDEEPTTGEHEVASDAVDEEPSGQVPSALRDAVSTLTRGRSALFVSNRNDPQLRDRLTDLFGFRELEWCAGDLKRRQSLEGSIASGTYDFVLGATGFLSHSVDGQLVRACKRGKVPYVRVYRGRPLACLRAFARELGLAAAV